MQAATRSGSFLVIGEVVNLLQLDFPDGVFYLLILDMVFLETRRMEIKVQKLKFEQFHLDLLEY